MNFLYVPIHDLLLRPGLVDRRTQSHFHLFLIKQKKIFEGNFFLGGGIFVAFSSPPPILCAKFHIFGLFLCDHIRMCVKNQIFPSNNTNKHFRCLLVKAMRQTKYISLLIPIIDTTYINSYAMYVRVLSRCYPIRGNTQSYIQGGGGFTPGAKVITQNYFLSRTPLS